MGTVTNLLEYRARKQVDLDELMAESDSLIDHHIKTLNNLQNFLTRDPVQLILTSEQVHNNWHMIKSDPLNNNPEIESPEEYIEKAKLGLVTAGAADVVVIDKLPE